MYVSHNITKKKVKTQIGNKSLIVTAFNIPQIFLYCGNGASQWTAVWNILMYYAFYKYHSSWNCIALKYQNKIIIKKNEENNIYQHMYTCIYISIMFSVHILYESSSSASPSCIYISVSSYFFVIFFSFFLSFFIFIFHLSSPFYFNAHEVCIISKFFSS